MLSFRGGLRRGLVLTLPRGEKNLFRASGNNRARFIHASNVLENEISERSKADFQQQVSGLGLRGGVMTGCGWLRQVIKEEN